MLHDWSVKVTLSIRKASKRLRRILSYEVDVLTVPLIRLIFARVITFLRNFLHAPSFLLLSLPFEELVEKWFPFMDVEL